MRAEYTAEQASVLLRLVEVKLPLFLTALERLAKEEGLWPEETEGEWERRNDI